MQNVNIIKESKNKTDIVYVFLIDQFFVKTMENSIRFTWQSL